MSHERTPAQVEASRRNLARAVAARKANAAARREAKAEAQAGAGVDPDRYRHIAKVIRRAVREAKRGNTAQAAARTMEAFLELGELACDRYDAERHRLILACLREAKNAIPAERLAELERLIAPTRSKRSKVRRDRGPELEPVRARPAGERRRIRG